MSQIGGVFWTLRFCFHPHSPTLSFSRFNTLCTSDILSSTRLMYDMCIQVPTCAWRDVLTCLWWWRIFFCVAFGMTFIGGGCKGEVPGSIPGLSFSTESGSLWMTFCYRTTGLGDYP